MLWDHMIAVEHNARLVDRRACRHPQFHTEKDWTLIRGVRVVPHESTCPTLLCLL